MLQAKTFDSKSDRAYFYNRIIYPEQFKGNALKTIFHIYNTYYQFFGADAEKMERLAKEHLPNCKATTIEHHLQRVAQKFDAKKATVLNYDSFTEIEQHLAPEEMYFMQGTKNAKRRLVALSEFKFMLKHITQNVYMKHDCSNTLTNSYFLSPGFKEAYTNYTSKALCRNKLTHIMQVLQKLNYLHITSNVKGSRRIQIGAANPFYMLHGVPEVQMQSMLTKDDRQMQKLLSVNELLQDELHSRIEEVAELESENAQLEQKVEMLTNMLIEQQQDDGKIRTRSAHPQSIMLRAKDYLN